MLAKFRGGTAELQMEGGRWRGALSSLRTVLPDCRDSVDYFAYVMLDRLMDYECS